MNVSFTTLRGRRVLLTLLVCAASGAWMPPAQAQPSPAVKVEAPWARPTVQGQQAGGGFLRIESKAADRLVGGSTPVAGRVELHTMAMEGDVMRMRQLDAIDVPANKPVELKPGSLHLMLMELRAPLKAGDRFPLTLRFEKAGEVTVEVAVQNGPAAAAHKH
ncbi:copper chaperone PCu(A)C [Aquincola sp. MAHUQ-54]|uniref:Copper chaperone PCu(A)C n=1 Tax=Aquincola agrisoli TaxID=3119538 RepID=A0AAW9Q869_9BURK